MSLYMFLHILCLLILIWQLTNIETDRLVKGLNFSITFKILPNKDIIATIKDAVNDLEKEEDDTIRAKVSLIPQNSNF